MARFTSAGGGGGEPGAPGADGADALWSFEGEWANGIDYAAGSVVEYQGSSYYHPTGQFSSYSPPTNGWLLVSSKGEDGADGSAADTGQITFLGVYIIGSGAGSGDGYGNGTIKLLPDGDLIAQQYHEDQYLIIDPTAPNHIHIRAGGEQDASAAELIFGGERTKVQVSDTERLVLVSTRPPGEEVSENQWIFGSDGLLTGPAPDSLIKVNGLYGKDADPLFLLAPDTVVISGDGGEFLDDPTVADNQIATIGDLPTGATGTFTSQDNKTVTVTNGIITSIV
jgi:hypothetical protein